MRFSILLGMAGFIFLTSCNDQPTQPETPFQNPYNILWITVEDMSPRLPCYGDSVAHTPHIDRLAAEGVKFTRAFSISGVCAPSRAALITGMYPTTIGAHHMRTMKRTSALADITDPELLAIPTYEAVPGPEVKCFTEYLRAKGYYCTNNSKEDYQFARPITAWDESSNKAHWRNRPKGKPFFSVFNIGYTHESRVWGHAEHPWVIDTSLIEVPPYYPNTPTVRRDIARHYNNIQIMDSLVGNILKQLEEDNLLDSTIIFYFSDHGDCLPRAKRWVYDSGLRVPLIIRWPDGTHAGTVNDELVSFVDFAPTMLSLTGIEPHEYIQGQAFLGPYKAESPRDYIFAARDRMDPAIDSRRAVRDKRYKYIRNYMPDRPYVQFLPYRDRMAMMKEMLSMDQSGTLTGVPAETWFRKSKPQEELYDTQTDPHEIYNLARDPEHQDKLEELRAVHEQWKEKTHDWGLTPEPELKRKLWPPDGVQPTTAPVEFTFEDSVFSSSLQVSLHSSTEGASIAYSYRDDSTEWQLYTGPVTIDQTTALSAQAIRIGYKHSPMTVHYFTKQ